MVAPPFDWAVVPSRCTHRTRAETRSTSFPICWPQEGGQVTGERLKRLRSAAGDRTIHVWTTRVRVLPRSRALLGPAIRPESDRDDGTA